jgi:hypothetical protein
MSELAILAVSSAGVTVTVAIAIFVLGRRASDAERRAGDHAARAAALDGKLLAATNSAEQWRAKATDLEARNATLVDLLSDTAADLPADGARGRLHAKWFAADMSGRTTPDLRGVSVPTEPKPSDRDGLINPNE